MLQSILLLTNFTRNIRLERIDKKIQAQSPRRNWRPHILPAHHLSSICEEIKNTLFKLFGNANDKKAQIQHNLYKMFHEKKNNGRNIPHSIES